MKVAILTTGGTFDKVYFDANSEYSIGDPCITAILDEGNVNSCLLYTSPSPRD